MNSQFAGYVTSLAFRLDLSRDMILKLIDVSQADENGETPSRHSVGGIWRSLGLPDAHAGSLNALYRRGLVRAPDPEWPGLVVLTRAGELVVELLKEAGLAEQAETEDVLHTARHHLNADQMEAPL